MLTLIAETFAEVLGAGTGPALAGGRVGVRRPSGSTDAPSISIGVQVDGRAGVRWGLDPAGEAVNGALQLEVWTASASATRDLTHEVETRIRARRAAFRERGFSQLRPLTLEPVEDLRWGGASTSAFPVSRQKLAYAFAFQAPPVEEVIEGGPIRQIDVSLNPPASETLTVT